jgi:hypothetical protein
MPFTNPIVGGTVLIRPAIQSPDYQQGVSGWTINKDGSAEFNNIVIRGGTVVSGTALYYDGTPAAGNLVLSIAATAGTDEFGNEYQDGITVYGPNGSIQSSVTDTISTWRSDSGSVISIAVGSFAVFMGLTPPSVTGITWGSGGVASGLGSRLGTNTPQTQISSPYNQANPSIASITLNGSAQTSNGDVPDEIFMSTTRVWMVNDCHIAGVLSANNRIVGTTTITPVANVVTSKTITFPQPLEGTNFAAQVTAATSVPGSQVQGVGYNNLTSTGMTIYVLRTNTTNTNISYTAEGF